MHKYMRQHGQKGQAAVLLALAMIGLLAIVGLALDGGMLYWNQRRAQNGADAAALAGTSALADSMLNQAYEDACAASGSSGISTAQILSSVRNFASNNDVPQASSNVVAYYLSEYYNEHGEVQGRTNIKPGTTTPWVIQDGALVPCDDVVGVQVKASFPQQTFLAGVIGIANTNVTVAASATFELDTWCQDFILFALDPDDSKHVLSLTGSYIQTIGGGIHSNGGMQLGGGADHDIVLQPGAPVEYDTEGVESIKCAAITGGPDPSDPICRGISQVPDYALSADYFYKWDDFAPFELTGEPDGYIWDEADEHYYFNRNINKDDVVNADGTLRNGLYVTTGDIILSGQAFETDLPWNVTLVAKGKISVSGGVRMIAYSRGVLIFTDSDNTADGAVSLSGDENVWAGLIMAPNGLVTTSGASNSDLAGQLIAWQIDASGSNNTFTHNPPNCPVTLPRVLLVQ